uniref:LOB domain-containing protein n=1 Tax=Oryza glumipatula TaxID=40148 RepID=A0A0D9ZQX9_9ORYZ
MASVAYEADAQAADPVRGADGVVLDLERQLDCLKTDLATTQSKLALYRRRYAEPPPADAAAAATAGTDTLDRARALN